MKLFSNNNANAVESTPWNIESDPAVVAARDALPTLTVASEAIAVRLEKQTLQTKAAKRAHEDAANTVAALRSAWANGNATDDELSVASQAEAGARVAASEQAARLAALEAADSAAQSKASVADNTLNAARYEVVAQRRKWHEQAFLDAVINTARATYQQMQAEGAARDDPNHRLNFVRDTIGYGDYRFSEAMRALHVSLNA
jgi:hypothetical protein